MTATTEYASYFLEGLAAVAVLGILFSKNVLHAALLLLVFLLCLAGIYVTLHAEVLAVTQILVYAGGIVVLILFGIMLTERITQRPLEVETRNLAGALAACGSLLAILIYALQNTTLHVLAYNDPVNNVRAIGTQLMSDFVLPLEIAGVLLLITLVGAVINATSSKA